MAFISRPKMHPPIRPMPAEIPTYDKTHWATDALSTFDFESTYKESPAFL